MPLYSPTDDEQYLPAVCTKYPSTYRKLSTTANQATKQTHPLCLFIPLLPLLPLLQECDWSISIVPAVAYIILAYSTKYRAIEGLKSICLCLCRLGLLLLPLPLPVLRKHSILLLHIRCASEISRLNSLPHPNKDPTLQFLFSARFVSPSTHSGSEANVEPPPINLRKGFGGLGGPSDWSAQSTLTLFLDHADASIHPSTARSVES